MYMVEIIFHCARQMLKQCFKLGSGFAYNNFGNRQNGKTANRKRDKYKFNLGEIRDVRKNSKIWSLVVVPFFFSGEKKVLKITDWRKMLKIWTLFRKVFLGIFLGRTGIPLWMRFRVQYCSAVSVFSNTLAKLVHAMEKTISLTYWKLTSKGDISYQQSNFSNISSLYWRLKLLHFGSYQQSKIRYQLHKERYDHWFLSEKTSPPNLLS